MAGCEVVAREAASGVYRPSAHLRQPKEFTAVLASPLRLKGGCFELRYRPNETISARLGLVIPKRLARRAVLRNLLKRLARESFRHVLPRLPAVDLVLRLASPPVPKSGKVDRLQRNIWRRDLDGLLGGLLSGQRS